MGVGWKDGCGNDGWAQVLHGTRGRGTISEMEFLVKFLVKGVHSLIKPVVDLVSRYVPATRKIRKEKETNVKTQIELAEDSVAFWKKLGWKPASVRYLATALALGANENAAAVAEKAQEISESPNFEEDLLNRIREDPSLLGPALDASRFTTADELRDLLGRIIAGEVDKPGSFSRQTVTIAQNLTTENLHDFLKLRAVSWCLVLPEGKVINLVIGKRLSLFGKKDVLSFDWEKIGVSYHAMGEFQHLGLLQERPYGAGLPSDDGVWRLRHGGRIISVRAPGNDVSLELGMYIPTRAGADILGIFLDEEFPPLEGYFEEVCGYWRSQGFEIEEET